MLGQLRVEPEPELDEPLLDDPVLELPEPELPLLDDGVVVEELEDEEPELELEPVFPVVDVVAALAASAPPAKRPEVSAPTATTLRKRSCMGSCPFLWCHDRSHRAGTAHPAPVTCGAPHSDRSASVELVDDPMTIHRRPSEAAHSRGDDVAQRSRRGVTGRRGSTRGAAVASRRSPLGVWLPVSAWWRASSRSA
jgi:hypothetical protein